MKTIHRLHALFICTILPVLSCFAKKSPPGITPHPTSPFGIIYAKNIWTDASDFITNGNTTAVLSGNYVNITSSTQDNWNNTVYITGYKTKLEKWRFKLRFKLIGWSGSSYGLGFGLKSSNEYVQNDVMGFIQTTTSGAGGLYVLKSNRNILATGSSPLGIALNDVIDLEAVFHDSVFTLTAHNLNSGNTAGVSYTYASNGSTHAVPNTSYFSLMELGGTHQVQQVEISSEELTGVNLATIGDSKTIGYFSNTFAGRYAAQLDNNYPDALISAGGADCVTHVLQRKSELERLDAGKYLLSIGSNDLRFGSTLSELQTNYDSLVRVLEATGATVYHIVLPEDHTKPLGVNMLAFKDWVAATYPAGYINVWDSMSTGNLLKGIYDTGDGVHLNQTANNKIYEAIVASNKLNGGVTLPVYLLQFGVRRGNGNTAVLHWETDPCCPARQTDILKSHDGQQFFLLNMVTPGQSHSYTYTDHAVWQGSNYYRLRMTDDAGHVTFSHIISLVSEPAGLKVTGRQALNSNQSLFTIESPGTLKAAWQLIDGNGRVIQRGDAFFRKGQNQLRLHTVNIPAGICYLRIISNEQNDPVIFSFLQ